MTDTASSPDRISAAAQLSRALAAPADAGDWVHGVSQAVDRLAAELRTRRPGDEEFGADAVRAEPRLSHSATRQASDSASLEREVAELTALVADRAGDPPTAAIRERGQRLVAHLQRHLHADVRLAHEAYSADVGGGD